MKEGRKSAAQAALAQLAADFSDSALFQQAQVYAAWGDKDRALSTLERAYITGDSGLASLLTDPFFDPIRNEPRFLQLLKSIGFV
jgi:hypothetical protein